LFAFPRSNVKEYQEMATAWSKDWRRRRYNRDESDKSVSNDGGNATAATSTQVPETSPTDPGSEAAANNNDQIPSQTSSADKPNIMTPSSLERDYWEIVEGQEQFVDVDYGNDVDTNELGSGFPLSDLGRSVNSPNFLAKPPSSEEELPEPKFGTKQYYKETYWNLNNIPNSKNSVLRHVKVGINGINVPWLYFGCLFSTFCWHNEDNYMYSINYHHRGAPKQ
jgi:hypothetical protein